MDVKVWTQKLEKYFKQLDGAIVAYSGGVDSGLLAYAAYAALGHKMVAVIAESPSLARREYRSAKKFAADHGIPLRVVRTAEMENPRYRANQGDRCYYCKNALFVKLKELREQINKSLQDSAWPIVYGVNKDDLGDYRPGMLAAKEASIGAPYVDLGIDKRTIREICTYYNLEIAEKPAMPCLASRLQYGQTVTTEKLKQVEVAENFLGDLGFKIFRVRHHGDTARIEIQQSDFAALIRNREKICQKLHALGFTFVALDLDGFRSGSLNAELDL